MKKIINSILSVLKYLLLMAAFSLTLFIILKLNDRLEKSMVESISVFIPFGIMLLLFILNFALDKKSVTDNLFFNLTCCLVFSANIVVCLRSIFDKNMLFNGIQKMGINFNFFNDYLSFNKIMFFGLIIADLIYMFIPNKDDKEKEGVAKKVEEIEVI